METVALRLGAQRRSRLLLGGMFLVALQIALVGPVAAARPNDPGGGNAGGGGGSVARGYDISYPQCGSAYPTDAAFAIVGVNGGLVYSANPCLPSQIAWGGGSSAQLYANTGNPGPALSSFWPLGQTAPRFCDPANPDTADCAFDYGYNAAAHSYATAQSAYAQLDLAASPAGARWWLDVETSNSWRADTSLNVAALQGEVAYLLEAGVTDLGFYSTQQQWNTITGGTQVFNQHPSWLAGALSLKGARDRCTRTAFTGNVIVYTQYPYHGFDANYAC
jgi:hypothetical protein